MPGGLRLNQRRVAILRDVLVLVTPFMGLGLAYSGLNVVPAGWIIAVILAGFAVPIAYGVWQIRRWLFDGWLLIRVVDWPTRWLLFGVVAGVAAFLGMYFTYLR
jgi:hypothetical protein